MYEVGLRRVGLLFFKNKCWTLHAYVCISAQGKICATTNFVGKWVHVYGGVDVELRIIAPYIDDTWLWSLMLNIYECHNNGGMVPMLF